MTCSCKTTNSILLEFPLRVMPDSDLLADFTTIRTGGQADQLIVAKDTTEMVAITRQADATDTPLHILSGGSNTLISDEGFRGTVMVVAAQGARACPTDGGFILHANAGEVLDSLIEETVKRRWSGLELLSGIPGLVGAAPIQNVGAYGAEVSSAILSVTAYDRSQQEVVTLENQQCHFGYRTSLFKENPGRYAVLSVDFFVSHDPFSSPINYTDVATLLHLDMGERVPLAQAREAVLAVRASKGTLLNVNDHDTWSAGSFFTNPLITTEISDQLPKEAPRFPQEDGTIKTSAAWLIEHAGFEKGYGTQEATLSTKHVLAVTNRGGATTSEIIALGREIQQGVQKKYGITLTPEPTLVGMPW